MQSITSLQSPRQELAPAKAYKNSLSIDEFNTLLHDANRVFVRNHPPTAAFERAIFFGWHCAINDCKFCYMSTQPKEASGKPALRSTSSILAEVIITKELGWQSGFFSGGINAKNPEQFRELLSYVTAITKEKVWINIGPVSQPHIELYAPYVRGVVGSIETVNPAVREFVCPSKPIGPYVKMFSTADALGIKKAMTMILGIGESIEDFPLLEQFIREYRIDKLHLYNLIPHDGTYFEGATPPSVEYQAAWIAKTRIAFPKLDIQAGIWEDKTKDMHLLLLAGANSLSKFPALKKFGSSAAHEFEAEVQQAGRRMQGSLTTMPQRDWNAIVNALPFDTALKEGIREKLHTYLKTMQELKMSVRGKLRRTSP
ncbi:radical SAM protein [Candidatus Woesearchaeota archaeon]|nr:radical SAM protein [Candidatus Woesearchaeota archaeon]